MESHFHLIEIYFICCTSSEQMREKKTGRSYLLKLTERKDLRKLKNRYRGIRSYDLD
jgi:hypothetical protein